MALSQDGQLRGKVALITGGTSGIGRDTAVLFAREGAKVVLTGRREAEGQETVKLAKEAGGEATFVKADVSKAADAKMTVQKTVEIYGRIDIAFNNAGVEGQWLPLTDLPEEEFDQVISINVKGVWLSMKYEIAQMLKQGGGGAIVNMSSVAGLMGAAGASAYTASKHAVIGMTRTAALEYAKAGIRVNAVCPAVIVTPMAERAFADPAVNKWILSLHAVGRFGQPMEVAEAVLWMSSDKASFMTGDFIVVDGGMMAGRVPPG
jgi:NAD(P)-dependent dehydrogenase (short-subunit alcohol dehydrogenase family)